MVNRAFALYNTTKIRLKIIFVVKSYVKCCIPYVVEGCRSMCQNAIKLIQVLNMYLSIYIL